MTDFYHNPVLVPEVIDALDVRAGGRYIDATLGGGGHTREMLKRKAQVLGIDADAQAIEYAQKRLQEERLDGGVLVQGNFAHIGDIARLNGFTGVDGILFDLGVSSHQLDTPGRGFSYRYPEARLDSRLDQSQGITAGDYIRKATGEELYEIFTKFGEEERARAIAHAIVLARSVKPIETVGDLASVISQSAPGPNKEAVLSRIFQAVRIAVNRELEYLHEGLKQAHELLRRDGRIAVMSFHSLEDRIVKQTFRTPAWRKITKKPIIAEFAEQKNNKRARSAKLRVAQKV